MEDKEKNDDLKMLKYFAISLLTIMLIIVIICVFSNSTDNIKNQDFSSTSSTDTISQGTSSEPSPYMQKCLTNIKMEFENNNYDEVINIYNSMIAYEPESPLCTEANTYFLQAQEQKEKALLELAKNSIEISKIKTSAPNSADGVDLYIYWKNKSEKIIKYAYFTVVPYNAVDDIVYCEIRNTAKFTGKETGPFKQNQGSNGDTYWECPWYNSTIKYAKLVNIQIEYMDGTSLELSEKIINQLGINK